MELDLHGYELAGAIIEILYKLEECKIMRDSKIEIIHGYKQGSVLRNYINSDAFLAKMKKNGFQLKKISSPNKGKTNFSINF